MAQAGRTRGWDDELHVRAETTTGQPIDVVMGITRDPRHAGRKVVAFAAADGPSVVLRIDGDVSNGPEFVEKIRRTLAELMNVERRGGV
ncbi:hypothetical protein [Amycolatopsis sp. NPDC051716]|uniref:hypothetical protein n=1 Tax=Amycolatopsis sp. NPDC051716 TaxID=3155804 RepID=UPI00341A6537